LQFVLITPRIYYKSTNKKQLIGVFLKNIWICYVYQDI